MIREFTEMKFCYSYYGTVAMSHASCLGGIHTRDQIKFRTNMDAIQYVYHVVSICYNPTTILAYAHMYLCRQT